MPHFFTPPTYTLKNVNAGPLLNRYQTTFGYSVIKRGVAYEQVLAPSIETFTDPAVDIIYQGGHRYEITAAEAALLTDAGYAVESSGGYRDMYVNRWEN